MKKTLIVLVALLAMVAFVSVAVAQKAEEGKKTTTTTTTTTTEKTKAPKPMKFSGTVAAYEAGKMIKIKGAKDKEMTFDVTADTKVKGEVKEGAKAGVTYKKEGEKMVATAIGVPAPKKPKAEKK